MTYERRVHYNKHLRIKLQIDAPGKSRTWTDLVQGELCYHCAPTYFTSLNFILIGQIEKILTAKGDKIWPTSASQV